MPESLSISYAEELPHDEAQRDRNHNEHVDGADDAERDRSVPRLEDTGSEVAIAHEFLDEHDGPHRQAPGQEADAHTMPQADEGKRDQQCRQVGLMRVADAETANQVELQWRVDVS